ncbi:MAG: hypothetical protein NTY08_17355 [Proteobacteria bacterium]|jgi:hypothetical protein|nr:hypothetical protein [Pseudomonadota bacterium]
MDSRRKMFDDTADELQQFFKRVGKVWIYEELKFLDLDPDMMTGEFWGDKVQSLINFCDVNTKYHVISCRGRKIYNKFVPDSSSYHLADGNADPDLFFDFETRLSVNELLQIGCTVFAPVIGKINNSNDR